MPDFLEERLRSEYAAKGKSGRELDRVVYGTMNNQGLMHGNKITRKGRAAERKHARDVKRGRAK